MKPEQPTSANTGDQGQEVLRALGKAHHALSVAYGSALVLCWLGLQAIALFFVTPKLAEMYADFGGELPRVTRGLINTSHWLTGAGAGQQIPGWYIAAPIALIVAFLLILFMYRVPFGFYLVVPILIGSVFAEIAFLIGPLYQMAGNIANF